jgi:ceramide glucosyltransferase
MEGIWYWIYVTLAVAVATQAFLMALQTYEHRRYVCFHMRRMYTARPLGRVCLFVPCKGIDTGLERNLRAAFQQDHPDYEVIFIVESTRDPACATIRRIMAEYRRIPSRLVVAGLATDCGQKVHNLRAATEHIPADIKYLAFMDSDARPRRQWLRWLVHRLDRPGTGAATGYRWYVPVRFGLASSVLYSINSAIALLLGPRMWHVVWGGSWAIRRDLFDALRIRDAWQSTLSDDLVVSRLLSEHKLGVYYAPPSLVASPLDYTLRETFAFIRRQYVVVRFYRPTLWLLSLASSTVVNGVFLWGLGLALLGAATGRFSPWTPTALCGLQYVFGVVRAWMRQDVARLCFPTLLGALRGVRWFDIWAGPLAGLVQWIGLAGSAWGRRMSWRGITYELSFGGRARRIDLPALLAPDAIPEATSQEQETEPLRKAG